MADFSKQYCKSSESFADIEGDFDILEIAKNLMEDHYIPIICEGYGFIAIGKDGDGNVLLAFPENSNPTPSVIWKPYNEVVV